MAGGQNVTIKAPKAASIRAMTSAYGRVIPLIYGRGRVQANVIYYNDFKAIEQKSKSNSGGKGGGGTQTNIDYIYKVCVLLGLSVGPITSIPILWVGKNKGIPSKFGLSVFTGTSTQSPFGYLTSAHPSDALAYRYTSYLAASQFDLGNDPSLPSINAEVVGQLSGVDVGSWAEGDANPANVVNSLVGLVGGGTINVTEMKTFAQANGLFVSPVYTEAKPVRELLKNLCMISNCDMYYSEGILKFASYGDRAVTGYGVTFTPNLTPAYDLTEDDFLPNGAEPIKINRKSQLDSYNSIKVSYQNRAIDYNDDMAYAKDQASIDKYGERPMNEVALPEIANSEIARLAAQQILQRSAFLKNTYEFKLSWRYIRLEPMDIVTLTHPELELDRMAVRITEVEEDDDGLIIKAEELSVGVSSAARYTTQGSTGYLVDYNIPAISTVVHKIFEPPTALSGTPQIWVAVTPSALTDTSWGGCFVWVSTDNATYKQIGSIQGSARAGQINLAMGYQAGSGPTVLDTTSTARADISLSGESIDSGNPEDASNYVTLCLIENELIAYTNSALFSTGVYNLTTMYRGLYGTTAATHAINSKFARLDDMIFKFDYSGVLNLGSDLYFKFQSFNVYGGGIEDLSTLTPVMYSIIGASVANVAGLVVSSLPDDESIIINWNPVPSATYYTVEIRNSAGTVTYKTVTVTDTKFIFLWQETANLSGGPYRALRFYVSASSSNGTSAFSFVSVSNPVPAALTGIKVTGGFGVIFFEWNQPAEKDLAGYQVWLSNTSGFTPGPTNLLVDTVSNNSSTRTWNNSGVATALVQGTTYYLRAAAYDRYGKTGLNISSEFAVTVQTISGGISPGEITSAMIAAGAVDMTKFASGIRPPRVVTSLPTIDGTIYRNQDTVTLTTDGKLYRAVAGVWTKDVPAADVTGQLTNAQIADLAATKISGQLTNAQIAAIASTKITGQLTNTQIADLAATKITGTLIDSQIASVGSTKITGQLTNSQIADLAAAKITGQITSVQITDNAITAPKISAGAVIAGKIAANAVTATEIAANSINASKIQASSITTDKLLVGSSNLIPNADFATGDWSGWRPFTGSPTIVAGSTSPSGTAPTNYIARFSTIGSVAAFAFSSAFNDANAMNDGIMVTEAEQYRVFIDVCKTTDLAAASTFQVRAYYYKNDGTTTTNNTAMSIAFSSLTTSWQTFSGILTVPAGALRAWPYMLMSSQTAGSLYWTNLRFYKMNAGELTVDGTITANAIAAGAITTTKIAANAVTATEISAGAITTAKIAAGAVTANEIATNAITAVKVSAGAITTAKIAANAVTANEIAANAVTATQILAGSVTTTKLAAGAVTANEIAANTITAAKIAAGAIGATQIAANAITADKLLIGNLSNISENPGFELGNVGWTLTGVGTIINDPANAKSGNWCLRVISTGSSSAHRNNMRFPVEEGETYYAEGFVKASSGSGFIRISARDKDFNEVATPAGGAISSGTYTKSSLTYTVPAGICYLGVECVNISGTTYFDDVGIYRANESTLIADGAITTNKVAANAIVAGKIAANTITATEIAAGTITGDRLVAGTITADKIDSRNLSIKDASGNIILAAGSPLDFANVGGSGKPANNATVGATIGVNLGGQINSGNVSTFIANAAIQAAQIGSLNATVITAGTITTDKIQIGSTSTTATNIGGSQSLTVTSATSFAQSTNISILSSTKAVNGSSMYYTVSFELSFTTTNTLAAGDYNVNWFVDYGYTDNGAGGSVNNLSQSAFADYCRMRLSSSSSYRRCFSFVCCLANSAQTGTVRLRMNQANVFLETAAGGTYANGLFSASLSWAAAAMEAKV